MRAYINSTFRPGADIDIGIVIVEAVVLLDKANTVLKCE